MPTVSSSLPQIVLTDEQANAMRAANGAPVELRTASGQRIGFAEVIDEKEYDGWTVEQIARAKARLAAVGRHYSTKELLARLRSVIRDKEWTDEELRQMRAAARSDPRRYSAEEVMQTVRSFLNQD